MQTMWTDWLDGELRGRGGVCAALVAVALCSVAGLVWLRGAGDAAPPRPGIVVLPARAAPPAAGVSTPVPLAGPAPPACAHASLQLAWPDQRPTQACVAAPRVVQDGGLRRYVFEPEGPSGWRLRIEAAGGQVVAAQVVSARGDAYACTDDDCEGFRFGARPDGARTIAVQDAVLHGEAADPAAPAPWVRLRAAFAFAPDRQDPVFGCAASPVAIVDGEGARAELCPNAGTGVEHLGEGRRRYSFDDQEGRELAVTLAADGRVERVALQGLRCEGTACSGVVANVADPADGPAAGRSIVFTGTTLLAGVAGARRVAVLTGSVALPGP